MIATPISTGRGCVAGCPATRSPAVPHIAIANTASDLTPCNAHQTEVAASAKNGMYEAGGIPLALPVVSLGETLVRVDHAATVSPDPLSAHRGQSGTPPLLPQNGT